MARNRVVRRSGGGFRRSPGRLTEWFGVPFTVVETALPQASFIIFTSLTAAGLAKRPFTIIRTVGLLTIGNDQAAAFEFPSGALGGIVVSEKAVATGATAIPDPVTEVNSDEWFLYVPWAVSSDANGGGRPTRDFAFDSRAQRKVEDGEDIAFVVANAHNADAALFQLNMRVLVKLS